MAGERFVPTVLCGMMTLPTQPVSSWGMSLGLQKTSGIGNESGTADSFISF